MGDERCIICGGSADDHHDFTTRERPAGCQCDPNEWRDSVPAVCTAYAGDGVQYCGTCEHDRGCHVVAAVATEVPR
jgi:hypothetical protein